MFDPDITKGDWEWEPDEACESGDFILRANEPGTLIETDEILSNFYGRSTVPNSENKRAIAAVPQLLEVYHAAVSLRDAMSDDLFKKGVDEISKLDEAIKKLEEMHGE